MISRKRSGETEAGMIGPRDIIRRPCPLSPRQVQVLELVGDGLTDKEIAAELGITEGVVSGYCRIIRLKLGAKSRAHAVKIFYDHE
jgi:DNA-binding CsgD family transcriptional regulator